jgi:hypothetical protein
MWHPSWVGIWWRVWRYQRCILKQYIEGGQTTQWSKQKEQGSTKQYTKTKDPTKHRGVLLLHMWNTLWVYDKKVEDTKGVIRWRKLKKNINYTIHTQIYPGIFCPKQNSIWPTCFSMFSCPCIPPNLSSDYKFLSQRTSNHVCKLTEPHLIIFQIAPPEEIMVVLRYINPFFKVVNCVVIVFSCAYK